MSAKHDLWEQLGDLHCFAGSCKRPVSALVLTHETIFCLCSKCAPAYRSLGVVLMFDDIRKAHKQVSA